MYKTNWENSQICVISVKLEYTISWGKEMCNITAFDF